MADGHGRWLPPVLMALFATLSSCNKEATAPPPPPRDGPLNVSLTVQPVVILPGESSVITATAALPNDQALATFEVAVSGLIDTVFHFNTQGQGPKTFSIVISVPHAPIEGVLHFRAYARVGTVSDSASENLVIRDDGSPQLLVTAPSVIEPPISLLIELSAGDAAGVIEFTIDIQGLIQLDTIIRAESQSFIRWSYSTPIPSTAGLGDSIAIQATARDGFGKATNTRHVIRLVDLTEPTVVLRVDTVVHPEVDPYYGRVFFPGDTVRIHVSASDNRKIGWLGYTMLMDTLRFGDSVTIQAASDSVQYELVIPAGTNTPDVYIVGFAVDSSSNRSFQPIYAGVIDGTVEPVEALDPIAHSLGDEYQAGYVLDAKRDVIYYADVSSQIYVLGLSPFAVQPPLQFGGTVRSVDLTPSGDSLVAVVIGQPNYLLVWEIARGPATADTIPLPLLGSCQAWDMQVAANGHVLVTGWSQTTCPTVDVNLRTGVQRTRAIPSGVRHLTASGDRSIIVAWNYLDAVVYRSDLDTLTSARNLFTTDVPNAGPAINQDGTAILFRNRLYNSDLSSYRWIQPDPGFSPPAPALSADGQTAYLGGWPGYRIVDVATGIAGGRVILPRVPSRVIAHPDGQRLYIFGWFWVGLIQLH